MWRIADLSRNRATSGKRLSGHLQSMHFKHPTYALVPAEKRFRPVGPYARRDRSSFCTRHLLRPPVLHRRNEPGSTFHPFLFRDGIAVLVSNFIAEIEDWRTGHTVERCRVDEDYRVDAHDWKERF